MYKGLTLLSKWLEKRGFKDPSELSSEKMPDGSPSERQVYETYRKILSKEELNLSDVKDFCHSQITVIENRWKDFNLDAEKKAELIPYHTVYKTLLAAIDSPRSARENLEQQLNQYLNV